MAMENNLWHTRGQPCRYAGPTPQEAVIAILGEEQIRFQIGLVVADQKERKANFLCLGPDSCPTWVDYEYYEGGRTHKLSMCLLIRAVCGSSIPMDPDSLPGIRWQMRNVIPLLRYVTLVGPFPDRGSTRVAYAIYDTAAKAALEEGMGPNPVHLSRTYALDSILEKNALMPANYLHRGAKTEVRFMMYTPTEVNLRPYYTEKQMRKCDVVCMLNLAGLVKDYWRGTTDIQLRFCFRSCVFCRIHQFQSSTWLLEQRKDS